MKTELNLKRWEAPVLDKVAIADTASCPANSPGSPGGTKNASTAENGQCGSGPSS